MYLINKLIIIKGSLKGFISDLHGGGLVLPI